MYCAIKGLPFRAEKDDDTELRKLSKNVNILLKVKSIAAVETQYFERSEIRNVHIFYLNAFHTQVCPILKSLLMMRLKIC